MPFFKDLRRRSRANFNETAANGSVNGSEASSQPAPMPGLSKSTSTLNSSNGTGSNRGGSTANVTPAQRSTSTLQRTNSYLQRSSSKLAKQPSDPAISGPPAVPPRPQSLVQNKRLSSGSTYSHPMATAPSVPTSYYAPKVVSISDNTWVNQKVLLIYGTAGPPEQPFDGNIIISHHHDHFPATTWPVTETHFKALVHLVPGTNDIRIDFSSPRLASNDAPIGLHTTRLRVNYMPLNSTPPLQLVILLAKDSPATFDSPPEKMQREGNNLDLAIRKYRMCAHLWQAFTAEQTYRAGFGRRTFRFDEDYQPGTLSSRDGEQKAMRNEVRVHTVRCDKTVKQIRDLEIAQQNEKATRKGDLFQFAMNAIQPYFKTSDKRTQYVACLILDSHWDAKRKLITGHAALGGGNGELQLGIFGSQALHTYPSTFEEVVPALTDCTRTNTDHVAADGGEDSGAWWQAACIGIGAHLHEVGHAFGCPHQKTGIMERAYWNLNRTFVTAEPYSTRTKQQGLRPCLPAHEIGWHRLDVLRFRSHPCFRAAYDTPMHPEKGVQIWAIDQGKFTITARTGLNFIELRTEGDAFCESWIEYSDREGAGEGLARHVELTEAELRSRLPPDRRNKKLKIEVHSLGGQRAEVKDVHSAVTKVRIPHGSSGICGPKYGASAMEGSRPVQVLLSSIFEKHKLLKHIRVFHEFSLHGLEFVYEDGNVELFGKRSGKPKEVPLDVRRGETLAGFYIRAGFWIDALAVITNTGRTTEVFGNASGGEGYTLLPPRGYRIAGVHGTCGPWIDGFGIIICH